MTKIEQRLAAAKRSYAQRQEADAFSNESSRVRSCEPEPTLETVSAWKPDRAPSMYATARRKIDGDPWAPTQDTGNRRLYE
jgi:hypothetical protein